MKPSTEILFEKYRDHLFAAAFSVCRNAADAGDVVQDTFLQYHMTTKNFNDEQHIRAWLLRVALETDDGTVYFDVENSGRGDYSLGASTEAPDSAEEYIVIEDK